MFRDFDLINLFKIEEQKLRAFLIEVRNGYSKKNPYHNFRHAFDVTHCCYLVLTSGGASALHAPFAFLLVFLSPASYRRGWTQAGHGLTGDAAVARSGACDAPGDLRVADFSDLPRL